MKNKVNICNEFNPEFFANSTTPSVSIYLPVHPHAPENQQDPIRYKNLLREVEKGLEAQFPKSEYQGLLAMLTWIENDIDRTIWRHTKNGLGILASPAGASIYMLDYPVDEYTLVSDNYHIKPLIKNFQYGAHYYLLALRSKDFALYLGDFEGIEKLDMPEGVETEFTKIFDDYDASLKNSGNRHKAGMGGEGSHFGYDDKSDIVEKETVTHFRYVDDVVEKHFTSKHPFPVIVVGLPEHQAEFRPISSNKLLLEKGIEKPFDSMPEKEVFATAVEIIKDIQTAHINEIVGRYALAESKDAATSDPSRLAMALAERKVEVLFVEKDRVIDGDVDVESGFLQRSSDCIQVDDLTDEFAQATYAQGGAVYVLEAEDMPSNTGVAALFRY